MTGRKTERMKLTKPILILCATLGLGLVSSAFAMHGALGSTDRDAWIDSRVDALVAAGWVSKPTVSTRDLTNLQVAMLVAEAAPAAEAVPEVGATSSTIVAAKKGHQELVAEFKADLDAMSDELAKREDRLTETRRLIDKMRVTTQEALRKTGTQISGKGRFFFSNFRGFGANKDYGDSDWNNYSIADIRLQSVPVPALLFDTTLRFTKTMGAYYNDSLTTPQAFRARWIALTCAGKPGKVTAGDFFKSYTRLTLWNYDIPVHTIIEPALFTHLRKENEEANFLDHGNDWRMRGLELSTDQTWDGTHPISGFQAQVMGGLLQSASATQYTQEYGGTQVRLSLLEGALGLQASGLLTQDDPKTAPFAYDRAVTTTWSSHQMVGSLSANGAVTVQEDWKLEGSTEYAKSRFQQDRNDRAFQLKDWAVLSSGSVQWKDLRVGAKYLNVGPNFLSYAAQTNRSVEGVSLKGEFNGVETVGYHRGFVTSGDWEGDFFGDYDRLTENILPYGDATPNRKGFLFDASAKLGMDGWVQPQARVGVGLKEFQPLYVRTGVADYVLPADSLSTTAVARSFQHLEGALVLDFSKLVESLPATSMLSADFKHQTSDPGLGDDPFKVDTLLVSAEAGPFKRAPVVGALIFSAAFERVQARGREFVLTGVGNPGTLSAHIPKYHTAGLGTFTYADLNVDRTTFAFGFKWPVTKIFRIYGDWLSRKYVWKDQAGYDRRDQIWKLTHELTF